MKKESCRHTKKLSAYIDGELSESGMDRVRTHLAGCPICRSCLEKLKTAKALMLEMEDVVPSTDFDARFQEKVAASTASTVSQRSRPMTGRPEPSISYSKWAFLFTKWRPYALAAAATGALVFFIFTGSNGNGLSVEEMFLAEHLEILQEYEILSNLVFLENLDLIETMKLDS